VRILSEHPKCETNRPGATLGSDDQQTLGSRWTVATAARFSWALTLGVAVVAITELEMSPLKICNVHQRPGRTVARRRALSYFGLAPRDERSAITGAKHSRFGPRVTPELDDEIDELKRPVGALEARQPAASDEL
jgi:hypothetical protein